MDAETLEKAFNDLLALVPLATTSEVLEEVATSIDVDVTAVAGNRAQILRIVIRRLNSDDFDTVVNREDLIIQNLTRMRTHLGFDPVPNMNVDQVWSTCGRYRPW